MRTVAGRCCPFVEFAAKIKAAFAAGAVVTVTREVVAIMI